MGSRAEELENLYKEAKKLRRVNNREEFANAIDYSRSHFHRLTSGQEDIDDETIQKARNFVFDTNNVSKNTDLKIIAQALDKLTNLPETFASYSLHRQQLFISVVFSYPLSYFDDCYRTPGIHPIFADKALVLKEKRLLEIQQPLGILADLPEGTPARNHGQMSDIFDELQGLAVAMTG